MSKVKKGNKKKAQTLVLSVYNVEGVRGTSGAKIVRVNDFHKEHEKVQDDIIDTLIHRNDRISDKIIGEIRRCNITYSFVMQSKKLPVMYLDVFIEKPLRRIRLFRVYLYFTVQANVKSSDELFGEELEGQFSVELSMEGKSSVLEMVESFDHDDIILSLKNFVTFIDENEFLEEQVNNINEKLREEYSKEFEYFQVPQNRISLKNYRL